MHSTTQTLFDRLGGEREIRLMVYKFYDRVLEDPELAPYFRRTPMDKLRQMQFEFFSAVLGGPTPYTGRPLAYVHHGRGITTRQLQLFVEHLLHTIQLALPNSQDAEEIIGRVNTYADLILDGASGESE